MSLVNIISAIGNNSSIYPLLVRDCGIEIPSKVGMTYTQNLKDSKQMANNAVRELMSTAHQLFGLAAFLLWIGFATKELKNSDTIRKSTLLYSKKTKNRE